MKKFLLIPVLFLIAFLTVPFAYAASIGNPDTLGGPGKVKLDLEYDNSHQDLQFNGGHQSLTSGGGTFKLSFPPPGVSVNRMHLNTETEYAVGTLGVHKNVDIFAGIGVNRAKLGFDLVYISGTEGHGIKDNSNVPWKIGARAKFGEVAGVTFGGMVQYSAFDMNGRYEIGNRDLSILFPGNVSYSTKTEIREWQAALTAHTHMWVFNPYAGATYMKLSAKNLTTVSAPAGGEMRSYTYRIDADAKEEHNVGVVIGTGIQLPIRGLSANLEHRAFNERATTASLSYRF